MKQRISLCIIALPTITFVQPSQAASSEQEIGGGYVCRGTLIFNQKTQRDVALSVAKRVIQKKIDILGSSKRDKARKAELNNIKTCSFSPIKITSSTSSQVKII